MEASGTEIAYSQPASSDTANTTYLMHLSAACGRAGGALPDPSARERIPSPLSGASVSESLVTLSNTGARVSRVTTWSEPLGAGLLEFQETVAVSGQRTIEYWLFG